MEVEAKTEDETTKKKAGRPRSKKKIDPIKKKAKQQKFERLFGHHTKKKLIETINRELEKFINRPECRLYRFGIQSSFERIAIYARSEVYTCSVIYFEGSNQDTHILTYDPIFVREVIRLDDGILGEFVQKLTQ